MRTLSEIESGSREIYTAIQARGLRMDVPRLTGLVASMQAELDYAHAEVSRLAGRSLEVGSSKKLGTYLLEQGIRVPVTGKGSLSVTKDFLENLPASPLITAILKAKDVRYRLSQVEGVLERVQDGRVYPEYRFQEELGRPHAAGVNPMNWVIELQACLIPDEGYDLYAVDFKSAELRVLAALAQDQVLLAAIKDGKDIHREVAAMVHGIPAEQITDAQRSGAKCVVFGAMYGQTPYGLAKALRISEEEATHLSIRVWEVLAGAKAWLEATATSACAAGEVSTVHGRMRDLYATIARDPEAARRLAVNHVVQSTSADIMRNGLINMEAALSGVGGVMLLTRHDEVVFMVPVGTPIEVVKPLVQKAMVDDNDTRFPLAVELSVGKCWGQGMSKV